MNMLKLTGFLPLFCYILIWMELYLNPLNEHFGLTEIAMCELLIKTSRFQKNA